MTPTNPPNLASKPGEDAFLTPPQLRALKIAVAVMSVILFLLMGGIVARIIYLASSKPGVPIAAAGSAILAPPLAEIGLALPAGAVIRSATLSGNRLAIHHTDAARSGDADSITILDLATGRVISTVQIARKR